MINIFLKVYIRFESPSRYNFLSKITRSDELVTKNTSEASQKRSEPKAKRAKSEASQKRSEPKAKRAKSEASQKRSEPKAKRVQERSASKTLNKKSLNQLIEASCTKIYIVFP